MEQQLTTQQQKPFTLKEFFGQQNIRGKFEELLGKRSPAFITSVLQIVSSSERLAKADPMSIFHSAAVAATLDLPLNNSLGYAYIVPYNMEQKDGSYRQVAQFQMGYKGLKQLSIRSGLFKIMHESDVREGEIKSHNRLTGQIEFDWIVDQNERAKKKIVGYVSYFELTTGYSNTLYMSIEELEAHARKYSQTFKKGFGIWKDDFNSMCLKTVSKLNLSKNAPMSIDMKTAITVDQGVVTNHETVDVVYVDNTDVGIDKASERLIQMIDDAESVEDLNKLEEHITPEQADLFNQKKEKLNGKRK